ncbi:MAG: hypothetical protein JO290_09300 [Sphingomonadaceae bacterium]|nr:hypothetical protein [Sphingomonadaceae bacterium]
MADEITLDFIGRTLLALQTEVRELRAEMHRFRDEQHEMRAEMREFKLEQRDFRAELREVRTVVLQTDDSLRRLRVRVAELEAARS